MRTAFCAEAMPRSPPKTQLPADSTQQVRPYAASTLLPYLLRPFYTKHPRIRLYIALSNPAGSTPT
jgi:DNA-binding transcriptional LysR family regulator